MKLSLRKLAAFAVASAVTFVMAGITATPASAAIPASVTIRLITPTLNASNSLQRADLEGLFTVDNDWFADGLRFQQAWAPAGSTINLVYRVTADTAGTQPLANVPVTLRVGKAYSISTAKITVDGNSTNMDLGAGDKDQLNVTHNTDIYGNVSFTLVSSANPADNLKPANAAPATPQDKPEGGGKDLYTQIFPQVNVVEKADVSDMTEFHFYTGDIASATPAKADIRLSSPVLTDANSLARPDLDTLFSVTNNWYATGLKFRHVWQTIGSAFNLSYHVTDGDGKPVRGAPFKLHVNKGYSNSNASVTNGTTAAGPVTGADDGAIWNATTDAFGNVLFNFQNTNTTGGEPAAATNADGVLAFDKGGLFSQIFPEVLGQAVDSADMTEIRYLVKPVVVVPTVKVSITASGRTVKVSLTNAKGKSAKITITGLKASTKKPTKDSATSYSFKVTKGKKTVKVTVNGKTTTKSLTIK